MPNILLISATTTEHGEDNLFGIPIHIIGIGKVNAAINTYKLIKEYSPTHVVNFGSCGNLKNHKVGEVITVGEVYDDFYGSIIPNHHPIKVSHSPYKLFTTDTFYDAYSDYSDHYDNMISKCDLVDMEGYSIAKVCKDENVFVSLYKWVSDDGESHKWEENAKVGYDKFKKVFKEWLEQQK